MDQSSFFKHVIIDDLSATPKYLQLAQSIIQAVKSGKLRQDEVLPSINELSFQFQISRDTAEKGYKHLKKLGLLGSVPGKGYFIRTNQIEQQTRVFLLFNKLSEHKKIIYDAFASTLGESAAIDFYIYNNDFSIFKKLISERKDDYSHFVIISHFLEGNENAAAIINSLPKNQLLLLDKLIPGVTGEFGAVYEDFENDIYQALEQALDRLGKYHTLKIVFPEYTYHPEEIIKGFQRFCHQYAFASQVVRSIESEPIENGEAYINLVEKDLVTLIEQIQAKNLEIGKEVGVISYNEIPLKKLILNGITTISSDFRLMGELAAKHVLTNSKEHVKIPFRLKLRDSL